MQADAATPKATPWAVVVLLAAMAVVAVLRWRLLDVPLERDEGEYAHTAALMLDGVPPYAQARNMKLPGIYVAYAGIMAVFGETVRGIHLGLLVASLATMGFLFLLGRALVDEAVGAVAAAVFGGLSMAQAVQGVFANSEHFVLFLAVPGLWLVVESGKRARTAWLVPAGILLGGALVVKQHGALLTAFGGLAAALGVRPWTLGGVARRAAVFGVAAAAPYLATCLVLRAAGVFDVFWFWTFDYARTYVGRVPWEHVPELFRGAAVPLVATGAIATGLAVVGLVAPLWRAAARRHAGFVLGFALFSFLALCPGFYFRDHYFVLLLPALALLAGIGARTLAELAARSRRLDTALVAIGIGAAALVQVLVHEREALFEMTPAEVSRATYGLNPFPESIPVGEFLARHTAPEDTIAVIGSEPQLYFYARRRPAHPFLYTYPLVEPQPFALEMQEELIQSVEASRPAALVFVQVQTSWLSDPDAPRRLFEWLPRYTRGFELALVAEIRGDGSRFHEGPAARRLAPPPNPGIYVYLRR